MSREEQLWLSEELEPDPKAVPKPLMSIDSERFAMAETMSDMIDAGMRQGAEIEKLTSQRNFWKDLAERAARLVFTTCTCAKCEREREQWYEDSGITVEDAWRHKREGL